MSRWVYLLGGALVIAAAFISPVLGRFDDRSAGRVMTARVGVRAIAGDPGEIVFGMGSGTIWPWFAYESGWQPLPWRSRLLGPFGETLYHSHSLYLVVLAELGVVGVLLLALVIYPLAAQWIRGGSTANQVLSSLVAACLVGFAFDLYLFKNFPVSLIWWLVVFGVLTTATQTVPSATVSGPQDPEETREPGEPPPDRPPGARR